MSYAHGWWWPARRSEYVGRHWHTPGTSAQQDPWQVLRQWRAHVLWLPLLVAVRPHG